MDTPTWDGPTLKTARMAAGWSQAALSDFMDTTQASVSAWETGKLKILPKHQDRLTDLFRDWEEMTAGRNGDRPAPPAAPASSPAPRPPSTLTDARRARGLSLLDLARALGVCVNVVTEWEQGRTAPCGVVAAKLSEVLGTDCNRFFARIIGTEETEKEKEPVGEPVEDAGEKGCELPQHQQQEAAPVLFHLVVFLPVDSLVWIESEAATRGERMSRVVEQALAAFRDSEAPQAP